MQHVPELIALLDQFVIAMAVVLVVCLKGFHHFFLYVVTLQENGLVHFVQAHLHIDHGCTQGVNYLILAHPHEVLLILLQTLVEV